jgi:hypothetical protein
MYLEYLERFSYCRIASNGSLNRALASSAVSRGSNRVMACRWPLWVRALAAQQLFELGPSFLARLPIWRVRRQVEQHTSCHLDSFARSILSLFSVRHFFRWKQTGAF